MALMGYMAIKYMDVVNSAKWYGKVNTVILYTVSAILILLPDIPSWAAQLLICLCGLSMIISLILYIRFYLLLFKQEKGRKSQV